MDTLIVLCFVTVFFSLDAAATPDQHLTDKAPTSIDDDRNLKLLSRVENLEDRDRENQAEIHVLRSDLNVEKQRTSVLEARDKMQHEEIHVLRSELNVEKQRTSLLEATIARLMLNSVEAEESTQQETKIIAEENVHDTRSRTIAGEHASRIRRQEVVPVVAFHATLTNHQEHTGVHQIIAFDNVITNIGVAYNPHIGSFIAPVPGVYVFSSTILGYNSQALACSIVKNGVSVANLYMKDEGGMYDSDSAMVVLHLNKGDDMEVHGDVLDKFIHGNHYSMFSGFLLHEDQPTESIVGK